MATQLSDIHALLVQLTDVMVEHGIALEWAMTSCDGVRIHDGDFERLFEGERVTGERQDAWIDVSAEKYGIKWSARLYRPVQQHPGNVAVQL